MACLTLHCHPRFLLPSHLQCGSGLTDLERHNPPPIGSLITYRFFEVSKKEGIPRFPTFVGIAVGQ